MCTLKDLEKGLIRFLLTSIGFDTLHRHGPQIINTTNNFDNYSKCAHVYLPTNIKQDLLRFLLLYLKLDPNVSPSPSSQNNLQSKSYAFVLCVFNHFIKLTLAYDFKCKASFKFVMCLKFAPKK